MISLDEALKNILTTIKPLVSEEVLLKDAINRIVAKPIIANLSQPPFDVSAMDGYALKAKDIALDKPLKLIGASQAGKGFDGEVKQGECIRIFTGAPIPTGADSVIMQEQASAKEDLISFSGDFTKGQHVRPKGQDFIKNEILFENGERLSPASLALCAAANNPKINVIKQPNIDILATGDELVSLGSIVHENQIISSNPFSLTALFVPHAKNIINHPIAKDKKQELSNKLQSILDGNGDALIITGGASVGDHDIVLPVLKSLGVNMNFYKIAIKPGKPLMFGTYNNKIIFGLPGNPVSAFITAKILVLPALRALSSNKNPTEEIIRLPLAKPLKANGPRRHFIRAKIINTENECSKIEPINEFDSANLSSLSKANALIIHKENSTSLEINRLVEVILL